MNISSNLTLLYFFIIFELKGIEQVKYFLHNIGVFEI